MIKTADNAYSAVSEAGLENGPFLPLSGGTTDYGAIITLGNQSHIETGTLSGIVAIPSTKDYMPSIVGLMDADGSVRHGLGFDTNFNREMSRLQGIATPVNNSDAANKSYVDSMKSLTFLATYGFYIDVVSNVGITLSSRIPYLKPSYAIINTTQSSIDKTYAIMFMSNNVTVSEQYVPLAISSNYTINAFCHMQYDPTSLVVSFKFSGDSLSGYTRISIYTT